MLHNPEQADGDENDPSGYFRLPTFERGCFTHILIGDLGAILAAINMMAALRYCDRTQWMKPIPTGRPGEHISLMTRRILPKGEDSL